MTDRRAVLGGMAGAAVAVSLDGGAALGARRPYRVGVIGSGWFGKLNLFSMMQVAPVEPVALCDVDPAMLNEAADLTMARTDSVTRPTRRPALYADYREMLAKERFDVVIVGTPDHWHTLPALTALKAGAHLYLEKPVCVDITEGKALVAAARTAKRVVAAGTQRRATRFLIEARDKVVRGALLGKVAQVDLYGFYHQRPASFAAPTPAPAFWDAYCGPAPVVPYRPGVHPRQWRAFMEFGNGYMGDIGVHFIDACRFLLDLGWPSVVTSSGGVFVDKDSAATVPDTQIANFRFGDLLMTWTNRQWGQGTDPATPWGARLYGDKGTLRVTPTGYDFTPARETAPTLKAELGSELTEFNDATDKPLYAITRANMRDFVRAIEDGGKPAADIEEAYISTACCILANTALKLGRPIRWDGAHVVGDEEAERALTRPYRAPWVHPA